MRSWLFALALVTTSTALAAPPAPRPFPAEVVPTSSLPENGFVYVFSDEVIASVDDVAVSATLDGTVAELALEELGCCAVRIFIADGLAAGQALVLSLGDDTVITLDVTAGLDSTPPTSDSDPEVIDVLEVSRFFPPTTSADGPGLEVTVDVSGFSDEIALAAFGARNDAGAFLSVTSSSSDVLTVALPGATTTSATCFSVVAFDVAGNESSEEVCVDAAIPPDDNAICGAMASGSPLVGLLGILAMRRRRRVRGA